jgi:hypothetical protein
MWKRKPIEILGDYFYSGSFFAKSLSIKRKTIQRTG